MTNRHEQLNHEELLHPADKQVDLALTDLETKQSLHILEGANTLGLPEDMRYMIEHDRVAKGYFLQLLAAIDQPTDALASTQTARHRAKNQFLVYISSISREKATNEELEQALFELPEIQAAIGAYLIQPLVVYFSHYATIRTKLIELMNDPTITDYDRRQLTILPERQQFVEANPLS
ncbi:MAG: hypothetical protein Q8O99_00750 [bacterium]|nr:hypothetical protein [bacterium]